MSEQTIASLRQVSTSAMEEQRKADLLRKEQELFEQLAREREEQRIAQEVIDSIRARAEAQAQAGLTHAFLMEVKYEGKTRVTATSGSFFVVPEQLTGASRIVYDYCKEQGYSPELVPRFRKVDRANVIDFALKISW